MDPGCLYGRAIDTTLPDMTATVATLQQAIEQAAVRYYRLVVLVGVPGSGKTRLLQSLSRAGGHPLINVNLELSRRMLELTRLERSRKVSKLLKEVLAETPGDVVLLDNLEILFDTALDLRPLPMLQHLDRNRIVVASWNGSLQGETLYYADPAHPEFQQFPRPEAVLLTTGQSVTP
jgi:hypothetical protein